MIAKRASALAVIVLLVATLGFTLPTSEAAPAAARRTIYMAAVEPRGGTSVTAEPFPTQPLPAGPGYVIRQPDATGRWEVSTYQWQPGFIMAQANEDVTLEVIGLNGAEHPSFIEGINVPAFTVKRGQVTTVNFRTGRPGFYRIVCSTHLPSMVGYLVVLPRQ